jgi:hypothetical protein
VSEQRDIYPIANDFELKILQGGVFEPIILSELFTGFDESGALPFSDTDLLSIRVFQPNSQEALTLHQSRLGGASPDESGRFLTIKQGVMLEGCVPYGAPTGVYRIDIVAKDQYHVAKKPVTINLKVLSAGLKVGRSEDEVLFNTTKEIQAIKALRQKEAQIAQLDVTTQYFEDKQESPEHTMAAQETLQQGHPILSKAAQNSGVPAINSSDAQQVMEEMPEKGKELALQRNPELLPVMQNQQQLDNAPKTAPRPSPGGGG